MMRVCIIGRTKPLLETAKLLAKNHKIEMIITSKHSDHDDVSSKDFMNLAHIVGAKFIKTQKINQKELQSSIKKYKFDKVEEIVDVTPINEQITLIKNSIK